MADNIDWTAAVADMEALELDRRFEAEYHGMF